MKKSIVYMKIIIRSTSFQDYSKKAIENMICGIDEAGRGPVVGPMVVAGVQADNEKQLKQIGVCDSKKCSPKRRKQLASQIKTIANNYGTLVIHAEDIDSMRKVMTLNEIEVHAFSRMMNKLRSETYYVDSADVNETRFKEKILQELPFSPTIISKHSADDIYPVVSAASILAKTVRDNKVKSLSKKLRKKINLPLGSGYPADPITRKFLKAWVTEFGELPPETRHSWKTAQKLIREKQTKKLDKF